MRGYEPTEAMEQTCLFRWAAAASGKYPELQMLHHIPNGGSRNPIEAKNLKAQGVKPGVPDLCLPVPKGGYHGLYIELKRRKGGRVSEDQAIWIRCLSRLGYRAIVCHGWDEAREEIIAYLGGQREEEK